MNFSQFFIQRPIFAAVLSLLILIAGGISLFQLPISEYPEVVPPTVVVRANFPGANPKVIGDTVAAPLEQAITGVENMLYMSSQSTADGKITLTITFALGTDLDNAQVQVQNRVTRTQPKLPEEVTRIGITVDKASPDLTMVVHLTSPDKRYDMLYLSNYAILNIKDELARLNGIGDVRSFEGFAAQLTRALQTHWQRDRFDFLVNNAGMGVHASITDTTEAQFDALVNVHLKGVFFLIQRLLPLMNDGGRILNLSSGLARFALPGYAAYAAMKGAIEVLSRYLAKELGPRGIAVNVVAPGAIETDFGGGAVRDNAQLNAFVAAQTALGRVGVPEDIGPLVAALLQPATRWVNAQRVEASGGMFL